MKLLPRLLMSVAVLPLLPALPAMAQDAAKASASTSLSDIVVTARKRDERLADVPITITALGETTIERQGISSIDRVAALTPGLQFDQGASPGDIRPSLRGIPLIEGRSNVAILVDGIDVTGVTLDDSFGGASSLFNVGLLDLARVEVIKGPQSVYFGRSAFSGAIQFVSKDPGDTFDAKINAAVGDRDMREISAHVGGPVIADLLKLKLSASYRKFGGFYTNPGNGARFADEETKGVAATAILTPTQKVSVTTRLSYIDQHRGPPALYAVARPLLGPDLRISRADFDASRIQQNADYDFEGSRAKIFRASVGLKADLNDQFTFTTLTGYNRTTGQNEFDFDRTNATVPSGVPQGPGIINCAPRVCVGIFDYDIRLTQISNDARLVWDNNRGLSVMVGGYYFIERYDQIEYNRFIGSKSFVTATRANISPRLIEGDTDAYSFFGSLSAKPMPRLTLTAELRYNREATEARSPAFVDLTQDGSLLQTIGGKQTFTNYNPRFSVDYKLTDDTLLYVSAARGSKPGGVNLALVVDSARFYDEESIWTYETGVKTKLFDNRMTLDAAAYYSDYRNAQVTNVCFGTSSPLGPEALCPQAAQATLNYVVNAGKVNIYGLDVNAEYRPVDFLRLAATYAYTDSTIQDLRTRDNVAGGATLIQYRGNRMPFIPRHSLVGTVSLEHDLTNGVRGIASLTGRYRSSRFDRFDNRVLLAEKTTFDAQVGIETDHIRLTLFAENLTNNLTPDSSKYGPVFNPLVPVGEYIIAPPKRTVGLRGSYRF